MREKAVLMLSGGLDSTVAAWLAAETYQPVLALTYDYGQQAVRRELGAGYKLAMRLEVPHRTVFLPFFAQMDAGALTRRGEGLPEPEDADLDREADGLDRAAAVWVPNRNGAMIAVGAAFAESLGASVLVVGFNAEEAATFPDNGAPFVSAQNEALAYSTRNQVRVESPTLEWTKAEIVARAMAEDWPLEDVWSCYRGDDQPCGRCESCRRFERALDAAEARPWYERRKTTAKGR